MLRFEQVTSAGRVSSALGLQTLVAHDPVAADSSLRVARGKLSDARNSLGPEWLHQVPWLGLQLAAAGDLCTIGMEAASAGIEVARLMGRASSAQQVGRLSTLLQLALTHLDPALASLARVAERAATTTGTTTVSLTTPLSEDLLLDVIVAPDKAPRSR